MKPKSFQTAVTTGKITLPVALLVLLGGWIVSLYFPSPDSFPPAETGFLQLLYTFVPHEKPLSLGLNLLLYVLIGFLLIPFNNALTFIHTRSTIQTSLFFIWSAFLPFLHPLQGDTAATLLLLGSLICFLAAYERGLPMAYIYHAWLLLGFASCLVPEVLLLSPVYLIGSYQFRILSFKSLTAGILGLAFSYLIVAFLAWAFQQWHWVVIQVRMVEGIFTSFRFPRHEGWWNAWIMYQAVLLFISLIYYWFKRGQINIRTRNFIHFILWVEFALLAVIFLCPGTITALLPVSLVCLSLLEGHFFTTVQTKLTNFLFILMLLTPFVLYGLILWRI